MVVLNVAELTLQQPLLLRPQLGEKTLFSTMPTRDLTGYILCIGSWLSNEDLRKVEDWARQYIVAGGVKETNFNGIDEISIHATEEPVGKVGTIAGILDQTPIPDEKGSNPADIQAVVDYGAKRIIEAKAPKLAKLTGYDKAILLILLCHKILTH